jgi:hypothetical protein
MGGAAGKTSDQAAQLEVLMARRWRLGASGSSAHTRGGPGEAFIAEHKAVGEFLTRQGCEVAVWAVGDGDRHDLYGSDRVGWSAR